MNMLASIPRQKVILRSHASLPQAQFINSEARFPAMVAGFGSGKSEAAIRRIFRLKFRYPRQNVAYYLPTYDLVKLIAYPRMTEFLRQRKIRHQLNKQDHMLHIANRGTVIFRTLDAPEKIVGFEVADSIVDELDTLKRDAAEHCWRQIIARNRQKKPDRSANTVGVATTPEGFRFVYEYWGKEPRRAGYELITASTYSNIRNLGDDYIPGLLATYPAQLIKAYLEGKFVNLTSGGVYPDFDRSLNNTFETIREGEELHIGVDFNVWNCNAPVSVIRGGVPLTLGELVKMRDTPHVIQTIKEKYAGHKITVYPDASGQNSHTTNAADSDIALLRQAGFNVRMPNKNPRVKDRVAAVNGMICNGAGERRWKINVLRCPTLVECLEQQVYDANEEPDKTAGKDHLPDGVGYFMHCMWPVLRPTPTQSKLLDFVSR